MKCYISVTVSTPKIACYMCKVFGGDSSENRGEMLLPSLRVVVLMDKKRISA